MSNGDARQKADIRKAIEVIVYVASRAPIPDIYHVGKIAYFADKCHLEEYGCQMFGDRYVAMKDGPVPSLIFDLLKDVRDHRHFSRAYRILTESFAVGKKADDHIVKALRGPQLELLSESDIECLDQSIAENGKLSFTVLKKKSHDAAYEKADLNSDIALEDIIETLPSGQLLRQHLDENSLI